MDKIREVRLRNPSPVVLPPEGGVAFVVVATYRQQPQQNNELLQISKSESVRHTDHEFHIYRE